MVTLEAAILKTHSKWLFALLRRAVGVMVQLPFPPL